MKNRPILYARTDKGCIEITSHGETPYGYTAVRRKINGVQYSLAHRYIYALKTGKHPGKLCVCHKCDNRRCVNLRHLFLGTIAENNADCARKGRASKKTKVFGESHGQSKLREKDALKIRNLRGKLPQVKIARKFKISQSQVSDIQRGASWKHLEEYP